MGKRRSQRARGVNRPVQDVLTRRCYITSQNHGYAVKQDALPPDWEAWFVNTNDGIRSRLRPFFGVQFHPEAQPGPKDTGFLFDEYLRLVGAATRAGEVGCLGADLHEALLHSLFATGVRFPRKGVLLSLGPVADKYWFADEARILAQELLIPLYATQGTAEMMAELGIECTPVEKSAGSGNSALDLIDAGKIDFVINIPREYDAKGRPDGYLIRRRAVDAGVPLITDLQLARAVIEALRQKPDGPSSLVAWNDYLERRRGVGVARTRWRTERRRRTTNNSLI